MSKQGGRFCTRCNQITLHEDQRIANVLHLLLSVITIGLWIPVWIVVALNAGMKPPICQVCGSKQSLSKQDWEKRQLDSEVGGPPSVVARRPAA